MSVILKNHVEATAQNGVGTNLSVDSSVGDLAVIVMSGQMPAVKDPFWPSGWSGLYSANTGLTVLVTSLGRLSSHPAIPRTSCGSTHRQLGLLVRTVRC